MSSQKGNATRTRSQKYKNRTSFKNDLHDTSKKTKTLNKLEVANVCERCKNIIEWKIKYKKYKSLKAPAKCTKCEKKTVVHSYHIMCLPCAKQFNACPKCCAKGEVINPTPTKEEIIKLDAELQTLLKSVPERKRRTLIRCLNSDEKLKEHKESNTETNVSNNSNMTGTHESNTNETKNDLYQEITKKQILLEKVKRLTMKHHPDDETPDSDLSDWSI